MTGYLDGTFKPDQPVKLREAVYGVLALLGYTNEDFTGDQDAGAHVHVLFEVTGRRLGVGLDGIQFDHVQL